MESLWKDVRYAARMLLKNPGFTLVAVITLALGIGFNTAVFSVVNAMLFRPLPVDKPEELVGIYTTMKDNDSFMTHIPMSYPDYRDVRDSNKSFSGVVGYAMIPVALDRGAESEMVMGEVVTGNYFEVLGVRPVMGRPFSIDEDRTPGANPVVVLNHSTWQRRFGSDPSIVGRTIRLNGNAFTVIGIAPPNFRGLLRGFSPELWVPMMMLSTLHAEPNVNAESAGTSPENRLERRKTMWMWSMGRLNPGAKLADAEAEAKTIAARLRNEYPDSNQDRDIALLPASDVKLFPGIDKVLYGTSFVLLGVVGLVLLIASANVANMLLARAAARRREIAVRLSLGASRWRLIRQLLTESMLLALAGGGLGLLLALWSNSAANSIELPVPVQIALGLTLDWRVLGFTLGVSALTAVLFGLLPALQASKTDLVVALKEESGSTGGAHSRRWLRSTLVVAQVSLSLVLLIAAGLSIRSMRNAHHIDPGFDAEHAVSAGTDVSLRGYDEQKGADFYRRLRERALALPGVEAAGFTSHLPLSFSIRTNNAIAERDQAKPGKEWPDIDSAAVGPGYFEAMGIPILQGRGFNDRDTLKSAPVVVVNETLAKRFWPGEEAVGRRVRFRESDPRLFEVVGVARDGKYRTLGEDPRAFLYSNIVQHYEPGQMLVVRTRTNQAGTIAALRNEMRQMDPQVPIVSVRTVVEETSVSLLLPRTGALLFGMFGVLGLVLASVGLYGVISYATSQRTREIGIRVALGANARQILSLIIGQGMKLTAAGLAIGAILAFLLTRFLAVLLYGISATDATTFVGVAALLAAVALLACYIPARRAARVDPMVALRYE